MLEPISTSSTRNCTVSIAIDAGGSGEVVQAGEHCPHVRSVCPHIICVKSVMGLSVPLAGVHISGPVVAWRGEVRTWKYSMGSGKLDSVRTCRDFGGKGYGWVHQSCRRRIRASLFRDESPHSVTPTHAILHVTPWMHARRCGAAMNYRVARGRRLRS